MANQANIAPSKLQDGMTRHGTVMVASVLMAAFFNYLYQLLMGILLGPEQYGVLFSLTSIAAITFIVSQAFQTSTAHFASKYRSHNSPGSVGHLWKISLKRTLLLGWALFLALSLLTPLLSRFLAIDNYWYLIILFSSLTLTFALPVNWGILQGLQRFLSLSTTNALWAFLKLAVAVVLIRMGLGLYGGLGAYAIAYVAVFIITAFSLKELLNGGRGDFKVGNISSYTSLTFLSVLAFAVLTNFDIILVKHYFSAESAGGYAAISVIGKVALYAPAGIAVAMFPKTSALFENREAHGAVLRKAVLFTVLLAGGVIAAYALFPDLVVDFLFRGRYPLVAPYLLKYGAAMALFALCLVFINYLLSLDRTRIAFPLLAATALQVGLITGFHRNQGQVIDMVLLSAILCTALLLPWAWNAARPPRKPATPLPPL